MIDKITVLDLDKEPNEIYAGRWISAKGLLLWLDTQIEDITSGQKVRKTEYRQGVIDILKKIRKDIK